MLFCFMFMLQQVSCFFDDRYHDTSLFLMNKLRPGQQVVGPAIIIDQNRLVLPAVYKHVCQVDKPYCNKQQLIDILWILNHVFLMSRCNNLIGQNRIYYIVYFIITTLWNCRFRPIVLFVSRKPKLFIRFEQI